MAKCERCGKKMTFKDSLMDYMICVECKAKEERLKIMEEQQEKDEERKQLQSTLIEVNKIVITTTDIAKPYNIIAPIIYNTTNRGIFTSLYTKLENKYLDEDYKKLIVAPELSPQRSFDGTFILSLFDVSFDYEGNVGQRSFDKAFYMSLAEMKLRAYQLGGNAIVGLRMDFDLDTTNASAFYLQMYGTAVKIIDS